MNDKYELLQESITIHNHTLHRIKALRSFGNVKAGDLGGYIESEKNLGHGGNCWVYDNAKVYENAWVRDSARVYENAWVYGAAKIYGHSGICGNAEVFGDTLVAQTTNISGFAKVYGNAWVSGAVLVAGNAEICGDAGIYGRAWVSVDVNLDYGIWNKRVKIDGKHYLISITLKKVLVGIGLDE